MYCNKTWRYFDYFRTKDRVSVEFLLQISIGNLLSEMARFHITGRLVKIVNKVSSLVRFDIEVALDIPVLVHVRWMKAELYEQLSIVFDELESNLIMQ